MDIAIEANLADIDLLLPLFDKTAAGVEVVVSQLLLDLADAQTVGDELVWDRSRTWYSRVMPPKLETSTTPGTDLNCFSSVQSSSDFNSMLS